MRKSAQAAPWAVYQVTVQGRPGPKVVCFQSEWDAIEEATPGLHRLIRDGILNEGEAERLARGTSGDDPVRTLTKKVAAALLDAEPDAVVGSGGAVSQEDAGPHLLPFPALAKEAGDLGAAGGSPAQAGRMPDGEVA